jgi:hypothetical protein
MSAISVGFARRVPSDVQCSASRPPSEEIAPQRQTTRFPSDVVTGAVCKCRSRIRASMSRATTIDSTVGQHLAFPPQAAAFASRRREPTLAPGIVKRCASPLGAATRGHFERAELLPLPRA